MNKNDGISIWGDNVPGLDDMDLSKGDRLLLKIYPNFQKKIDRQFKEIPTIEPFSIPSKSPLPAMIICPGGGYSGKADHEGDPVAKWINSLGYHAFVLQYRVSPYRFPYPLLDVLRAIKWVRFHAEKYNIQEDSVGVLGFSAGGHLASSAGTHYDFSHSALDNYQDPINKISARPNLLVLCYPVISFLKYGHKGSMRNFLGKNPSSEMRSRFSNELRVDSNTPPSFLWHTKEDLGVSYQNSKQFADSLKRNNVESEFHLFDKGPHGIGIKPEYPTSKEWTKLCANWLKKQGWK